VGGFFAEGGRLEVVVAAPAAVEALGVDAHFFGQDVLGRCRGGL
jgi:hypothetical protein